MFQRKKIQTLEQLVDIADRLEQVEGIEPRMPEVIRETLARVAPPEKQTVGEILQAWYVTRISDKRLYGTG